MNDEEEKKKKKSASFRGSRTRGTRKIVAPAQSNVRNGLSRTTNTSKKNTGENKKHGANAKMQKKKNLINTSLPKNATNPRVKIKITRENQFVSVVSLNWMRKRKISIAKGSTRGARK
jgi:hypothetical protein